ncbi:MAG: TSUP family transporter [Treponema sp.]
MSVCSIVFICVAVFFAGFFDSIAGGGGLISLPSYLFIGLPADVAFVCNKFAAGCGTTFSAINFFRSGVVKIKVAVLSGVFAFCTSQIGTRLVLSIDPIVLRTILFLLLPIIGVLVLVKRDLGGIDNSNTISKKKTIFFAILIGIFVGFYDGFFGPGTGTFAIIAYTTLIKYDSKTAAGNSKILNLFSNYSSLILGILSGKIIYSLVIPAALAGIAGNYVGSSLAIKNGNKIIRPMMIFVVVLLFINLLYNFITIMWEKS